jgi:hypothetical protein
LEWPCTCFASAGPFDARIDTSDANNYTSNADDCTTSNGKAITNALSDGDDGSTHPDAFAIPHTVIVTNDSTHTNANALPDGNANAVIVTNDGTYPNANDGARPNSNNCAYFDANGGGTHPNSDAIPDGNADDFNIAIGIPYDFNIAIGIPYTIGV